MFDFVNDIVNDISTGIISVTSGDNISKRLYRKYIGMDPTPNEDVHKKRVELEVLLLELEIIDESIDAYIEIKKVGDDMSCALISIVVRPIITSWFYRGNPKTKFTNPHRHTIYVTEQTFLHDIIETVTHKQTKFVSDQDKLFMTNVWKVFWKLFLEKEGIRYYFQHE